MTRSKRSTDETVPTKGAIRENVEAIVIALILALFIRTFVVQAFKIPSGSMLNTLQIGDHILVNKFIYGVKLPFIQKTIVPVKEPRRDDIVVFIYPEDPSKDFIKRVVGVEGDTVEMRDKVLFVNGKKIERDYTIHTDRRLIGGRDTFGPVTVPKDSLFVMGDNRDNSHDSRFWGFVPLSSVKGKAFMIYFSWNGRDKSVRWSRIGDILR